MATRMFPKGLEAWVNGDINWLTDTIKVACVLNTYIFNAAHDFYDDLSANVVGTPVALGSKTNVNGTIDAADPTFTAVPAGATPVNALVYYKDTGIAGTSNLLIYCDTAGNLPFTPSGADVLVQLDALGIADPL